jgi:hypothetical protein
MSVALPLRTLAAALAATCLMSAATPAAAAKFVFDVTLYLKTVTTTAGGDELSSVNITFQQTYEGPLAVQSYFVTSYGPPDFSDDFGTADASVQYGPVDISEAPVEAEIRAVADGFALTGGGGLSVVGTSTLFNGEYTAKLSYNANESYGYYRSDYDTYTEVQPSYRTTRAGWSQGFGVPGSGDEFLLPQHIGPLTGQDFLDGLAGLELTYSILGYSTDELDIFTFDPETGANVYSHEYLVNERVIYDGYARLNLELSDLGDAGTPVPEPSAWALMLLGFGGVGSAIRRRRMVAI